MFRSNAKPLKQVIKRYEEYLIFNKFNNKNLSTTCNTDFRKPHTNGPLIQDCSSPLSSPQQLSVLGLSR
ncbi:DUF4218 domain-containing protein [Aphis craccivora]|uniref:DUF4218 domain-containing protein n=1 Tax=Aphis craccivora TaxID=307492 RepID=A0A6G0Y2V0_APHCR|nr:DUF4218 domain-containing protein [Aphis craccivora]